MDLISHRTLRVARVWSARPEPQEADLVGQVVQRAAALLSARAAFRRRLRHHRRRARRERAAGTDRRARSRRRRRDCLYLHLRAQRTRRRSCLLRQDERALVARERRDADARREGRLGALDGALGRSERRASVRLIPDRTPHTEPGILQLPLRVLRVELLSSSS